MLLKMFSFILVTVLKLTVVTHSHTHIRTHTICVMITQNLMQTKRDIMKSGTVVRLSTA